MNTNEKHSNSVNNVLQKLIERFPNAQKSTRSGLGYDIIITINNGTAKDTLYFCVVKMNETTQNPYSSVSVTKWLFAVNNPNNYYFIIAFEKINGDYEYSYYSVTEFWQMTSKPKYNLYCYRNRGKRHKLLEHFDGRKSSLDQNKMMNIKKSIELLNEFKNSYKN